MSRTVSLTIAYYGADLIAWALRAVAPFVDEVFVMLTDQPSHGTTTNLVCPDSLADMKEAIFGAGIGDKLRVVQGRWNNESEHRAEIFKYVQDGDLIVVADSDECWVNHNLAAGINYMKNCTDAGFYKVRMTTLFRSFNAACTDPMTQDRIIRAGGNRDVVYSPFSELPNDPDIFHFGYCRSLKDTEYKWSQHGHQNELRAGWLERFKNWKLGDDDMHPTCENFWSPRPFDKALLPNDLKNHPYYSAEVVE